MNKSDQQRLLWKQIVSTTMEQVRNSGLRPLRVYAFGASGDREVLVYVEVASPTSKVGIDQIGDIYEVNPEEILDFQRLVMSSLYTIAYELNVLIGNPMYGGVPMIRIGRHRCTQPEA